MKKYYWLLSTLLAMLMTVTASATEVSWSVSVTPNDGCSVKWLAVKTPVQGDASKYTLSSFNLYIGYKMAGGSTYGATTSYMIISKSNASLSSVASSDVVAISTNAPTPANGYATYTFDNAELSPGTKYYLYWVSSNSNAATYQTTTQRLGVYKQSYEPGIFFGNTIKTDYSPAFYATLTTTAGGGGTDPETPEEDDGKDGVRQVLFYNASSSVPYRIPALAQAVNGDLIALTDYRQGKMDIGFGAVDIHARISTDNGASWGSEFCIAGSNAITGKDSQYYGDASIVADREKNEVLVMLVSGTVGFTASTRNNPIRMAYARATYDEMAGEWQWTAPTDITSAVYDLLPTAKSLFFTSGKICQSKTIKVGTHYRIYSGVCVRTTTGGSTNYNFVMYSDDFGETWKVLGSSTTPCVSSADECKCEELPNGNVVLSTRVAKGRKWTIFTYTNQTTAEGSWSATVNPSSSNGGIYDADDTNPCNGEILLVDAIRVSDQEKVKLALQTVATNRTNVTIWYKPLTNESDYSTPAGFAKSWEGKYQVSSTTSCYSTMILQSKDRIGFYFEENSYNSGYDMVYYRYPLETITNGMYMLPTTATAAPGDVNGDGDVDVTDIALVTSHILGTTPANFIEAVADVNGDGSITIADLTALVNTILSKPNKE